MMISDPASSPVLETTIIFLTILTFPSDSKPLKNLNGKVDIVVKPFK